MLSTTLALATSAFCLGACLFSLWVGRLFLKRDIRGYGEGNPGATNVFRAGGRLVGALAVALDMAKGTPFVIPADCVYGLPERLTLMIGMCAIVGNAFSPLLRFRGGKSLAVSGGVLLAMPNQDVFVVAVLLICLGFLFLEQASWIVVVSTGGTLAYVAAVVRSLAQVWCSCFQCSCCLPTSTRQTSAVLRTSSTSRPGGCVRQEVVHESRCLRWLK